MRIHQGVKSCDLKFCIIIRGIPGCGKTFTAKAIVKFCENHDISVVDSAADDFMIDHEGKYCFDPVKLSHCHSQCILRLVKSCQERIDVVIQHNTNLQAWESSALRENAERLGYLIVLYEPKNDGEYKNVHGVTEERLVKMLESKQDIPSRYLGIFFNYTTFSSHLRKSIKEMLLSTDEDKRFNILHCTCNFLESPSSFQYPSNLVTPVTVYVTGIFSDHRGLGLFVSYQGINEYYVQQNYRYPHITLRVTSSFQAADIGIAALEASTLLTDTSYPFDQLFHRGNFSLLMFSDPVAVKGVYSCAYVSSDSNRYSYFRWSFDSDYIRDTFLNLSCSKNVAITISNIPIKAGWKLADIKLSSSIQDDDIYESSDTFRRYLPRGLCFLISPQEVASCIVVGLPKYGYIESNRDPLSSLYLRQSIDPTAGILVTEKSNGETAHISFLMLDGELVIVGGSKNVHLAVRWESPSDIDCYTDVRYQYAREMVSQYIYEWKQDHRIDQFRYFSSFLLTNKLTAIFEYEDPNHAHIVPLVIKRLKFITFCQFGGDCSNKNSYERSYWSNVWNPMNSLQFADTIDMPHVWSFQCSFGELSELRSAILFEDRFLLEGCVLYFAGKDNNNVAGIFKCKNGWYICSRALREKVVSFARSVEKSLSNLSSAKSLKNWENILHISNEEVRLNKLFDFADNSLKNVEAGLRGRMKVVLSAAHDRIAEISREQFPLSEDQMLFWNNLGANLLDMVCKDFLEIATKEFNTTLRARISANAEIDNFKELLEALTLNITSVFSADYYRNMWPSLFIKSINEIK